MFTNRPQNHSKPKNLYLAKTSNLLRPKTSLDNTVRLRSSHRASDLRSSKGVDLPVYLANSTQYKSLVSVKQKEKEELHELSLKQQAYINDLKTKNVTLRSELTRLTDDLREKDRIISEVSSKEKAENIEVLTKITKVYF